MPEVGGRSHPDAESPCVTRRELGKLVHLQIQLKIEPFLKQASFQAEPGLCGFPLIRL